MDTRFRAVHVSLSLALVTLAAACSSPPEPTVDDEWDRIRIALIVDGQRLTGTLSDTPAGRDLLAQLPLTLTMTDFGSVEKVAELPTSLSITGAPPGADPAPGGIGYYAPWNDLVLYYGDQSYHDGIVRLGTLDGGVDVIGQHTGDLLVEIEHVGD
ncbi:cyclophilin-like fold protein [Rhodococcus aetherivorans]|uniref:Cyclophilin-like fold protein n=1 Tax=Rhodococcus aetherivorans TaxID=191292 RepID=A0AA46SB89_9NOCA|nr:MULTISPECIES: cyclophilin-like fold protein [Rhodococcus]PND53403.1 hypothetical protein CQZ88_03205 [Rhodococcus sp. ENV425]UYF95598.1 cyclophilin-like fold protein [Rhodococcus aetherivorans]WKW97651.1 cyclophilin-like fold protein [Rhodococcus aetherivorans]